MGSLYDDLAGKLNQDPRLTRRGGPRADIGLLLFNARDSIRELWQAADDDIRCRNAESLEALERAVARLRPLFGKGDTP